MPATPLTSLAAPLQPPFCPHCHQPMPGPPPHIQDFARMRAEQAAEQLFSGKSQRKEDDSMLPMPKLPDTPQENAHTAIAGAGRKTASEIQPLAAPLCTTIRDVLPDIAKSTRMDLIVRLKPDMQWTALIEHGRRDERFEWLKGQPMPTPQEALDNLLDHDLREMVNW